MVSAGIAAQYDHICEKAVSGWQRHPEYEEILGRARLDVWTMISRLPETEREQAHARVCWLAQRAPVRHLRSPACNSQIRRRDSHQRPLQPMASLEGRSLPIRATAADFAPRLVEWLWRQWIRGELARELPARDMDLLARVLWREMSFSAIARCDGQCKEAVRMRFLRVLGRARRLFSEEDWAG